MIRMQLLLDLVVGQFPYALLNQATIVSVAGLGILLELNNLVRFLSSLLRSSHSELNRKGLQDCVVGITNRGKTCE